MATVPTRGFHLTYSPRSATASSLAGMSVLSSGTATMTRIPRCQITVPILTGWTLARAR